MSTGPNIALYCIVLYIILTIICAYIPLSFFRCTVFDVNKLSSKMLMDNGHLVLGPPAVPFIFTMNCMYVVSICTLCTFCLPRQPTFLKI